MASLWTFSWLMKTWFYRPFTEVLRLRFCCSLPSLFGCFRQPWLLIECDEYGTPNFDGVSPFSISHFGGGIPWHTPFSDISRDIRMDRKIRKWVKDLMCGCSCSVKGMTLWSCKPPSCTKRNVILGFQAASSQMKRYLSRSNMTLTLPLLKT